MFCYVMLYYVMLCYVRLRYVTLCYVMLRYVMLLLLSGVESCCASIPDSYPVAFRRRKRGDAEDFGKEMRGAQRVMERTNSEKVASFPPSSPQSFARRLKATGYESASMQM